MTTRIVVALSDGTQQNFDGDNVEAAKDEHTGVLKVRDGFQELGVFQPGEFDEFEAVSV